MPAVGRLIVETSLDYLARRLRFLGYDVETRHGLTLERLLEAGRDEGRTVVTLSARRPPESIDVAVIRAPRDPGAALRAIVDACDPAGPPFSRCVVCNVALEIGAVDRERVPAGVVDSGRPIRRCPRCGRLFWHGSHVDRVRAWLARAIGREIPPPGSAPR